MADDALMEEPQLADDGIMEGGEEEMAPVERSLGFILDEEDEEKVAKHVVKLREDRADERSRNRAVWKRSMWWREGRRGIKLEKKQDAGQWKAILPAGMSSAPPMPNKTDRLLRRVTNVVLVDKPVPICEPGDDSPEARDAAEWATRFLKVKGSEAELNMARILRQHSDKSHTFGSAYGWVTMDPTAGGHRPRTMLAHPAARTRDDALRDPITGLDVGEAELQDRYVREDGYLTDNAEEADLQWLPGPKVRALTGLQLDFLPETARGIEDAVGVVIADTTTLGDLKTMFPDIIEELGSEKMNKLCTYRPSEVKDLLPAFAKEPEDQKEEKNGQTKWLDAQMVVTHTVYYESCAEYPYGAYAVIGGDCLVLHRQKWSAMMEGPDGESVEECLEIPVAQCRCLDDDVMDNPHGIGLAEKLGPMDEMRTMAFGFEADHMFRSANPIPMIPVGSIVQPKQFVKRDGSPVFVNPNGSPMWEQIPPLSNTVPMLRTEMGDEMNDESGLQQTGQGVEAPSVKSGIHAQTVVGEALKAVMNIKDNLGQFYVAVNRIILQQVRAFCTVEQLMGYAGDDGAYKQKAWSRTDFRTTRRVSIDRSSYTMMNFVAKQEVANMMLERQVITPDEYMDMVSGGINPILGAQDNPFLLRVRNQIEAWEEGPQEGWVEAAAQAMQAQAAAAQQPPPAPEAPEGAPMGGEMMPPPQEPPAPPPEIPEHPFSVKLAVDLEPAAAKVRHRQLAKFMASGKFMQHPKEWRDILEEEYVAMRNAAGIATVEDTQKAQQQQQEAASQAQQQQAEQMAQIEAQKAQIEQVRLQIEQQKLQQEAEMEQMRLQQEGQLEQMKAQQQAQIEQARIQQAAEAAKMEMEGERLEAQDNITVAREKQQIDARQKDEDRKVLTMTEAARLKLEEKKLAIEEQRLELERMKAEQQAITEAANRELDIQKRQEEMSMRRLELDRADEKSVTESAKPAATAQAKPQETIHERDENGRLIRSITRPVTKTETDE